MNPSNSMASPDPCNFPGRIIGPFHHFFARIGIGFTGLKTAISFTCNPIVLNQAWNHLRTIRNKIFDGLPLKKIAKVDGRYFPSQNMPGWPSQAFNHFLKQEIKSVLNPEQPTAHQTIFFAITNKCPLSCSHCYEWDNMEKEEKLSLNELILILRKIEDQGIRHIQISGGEPLARFDDLIRLLQSARYPIDFWLLTSGFGLTDEKAAKLKAAGLTGVSISLDHWDESAHNAFRNNQASFNWVRDAAKSCVDHGIVVCFGICVMQNFISITNLERYYELCHSWGASFVRLLEPRSAGKLSNQNVSLPPQEIEILESFYRSSHLSDKWKRHPFVSYPGYNQRIFGCLGAGERYLYIDSKGMFKPCPFCDHSYGSALTMPFDQVISQMKLTGCLNS